MAFAPPARRPSQSGSLRVACSRINVSLTRSREDDAKQCSMSNIHTSSASTISSALGPTRSQVVDERLTSSARKSLMSPRDAKGQQLIAEQIRMSKITMDKKQSLAKVADDLARELDRIKRREMESRLLFEKQMVYQKKHDAAHTFRAANHDAYVTAKRRRDLANAERDDRVRREKEIREMSVLQAQRKKLLSAKNKSDVLKSEMMANDLRIEQDRIALTMFNAAKARRAREEREQRKECARTDKFVQVTNQRWSHERDRQERCARSIEDTLRAIKTMKEEKTTLETPRSAAARQAAADAAAARLEKERARAREEKQKKSTKAALKPAVRQTPATLPKAAFRGASAGKTLFSDTASSNAKHTPRSSSVGRIRNRYGNWEADKCKAEEKSRPSSPRSLTHEESQSGLFIPEDRSRSLNHKEAQWFVTKDRRYYETPSVATDCHGNWIQVGLPSVVEQASAAPSGVALYQIDL